MSCYFDTSALVKIYHREAGTDAVLAIYKSDTPIYILELSRIEFLATILRKYREHAITHDTLQALTARFQEDLAQRYSLLKFSSLVVDEADNLLRHFGEQRGLRTLDSLQLAFFITYCEAETQFVCADILLNQLAKDQEFEVVVPEK